MKILSVVGYPRSGNTFIQQSLDLFSAKNNFKNDIKIITHTHDALELRKKQYNVFLLRDPVSCIASFCYMNIDPVNSKKRNYLLKNIDSFVDEQVSLYLMYIEEFINAKNDSYLLTFNNLIKNNINETIKSIFNYAEIDLDKKLNYLDENDISRMKKRNYDKHGGKIYTINYPRGIEKDPDYIHIRDAVSRNKSIRIAIKEYELATNGIMVEEEKWIPLSMNT